MAAPLPPKAVPTPLAAAVPAVLAVVALVLLVAMIPALASAGSRGPGASPSVPSTGAIEGRVLYRGEIPPPVIVVQGSDDQEVLEVGEGGGLQHAVAWVAQAGEAQVVEGGAPTAPEADPAGLPPLILDQEGYVFRPPVLAVRAGRTVRFTSQDPGHHNVRSRDPNPANAFSVDTNAGLVPARHVFAANAGHRPVALSCDVHPWMAAWVYVFDHPYFAVTDADGGFRITGVPAGRHTVSVRHPAGGLERDVEVLVEPGATVALTVDFTTADLRLPRR